MGDESPTPPTGQTAAGTAQKQWQPYKVKRGISVDRRAVPGSRYFEYRAVIATAQPARQVVDLLWRNVSQVDSTIVKKRDILRDTATERLVYDQVRTPVVSDRDYTLLLRKVADPDGQRFQITYETANHLGPAEQPKFVRIPAIRGSWTAEPNGQGGTRLTYTSFSEPGGSIPAFMVHGAQLDSVVESVVRVQTKLQ